MIRHDCRGILGPGTGVRERPSTHPRDGLATPRQQLSQWLQVLFRDIALSTIADQSRDVPVNPIPGRETLSDCYCSSAAKIRALTANTSTFTTRRGEQRQLTSHTPV